MWRRWWSIGSLAWGIGARGQPNTPSNSLRSCLLAGIVPPLPYPEVDKLVPGLGRPPFCALNHSRMTSQELSFLPPSSCISGSGPSMSGVNGCGHHICFFLALEPMNQLLVVFGRWKERMIKMGLRVVSFLREEEIIGRLGEWGGLDWIVLYCNGMRQKGQLICPTAENGSNIIKPHYRMLACLLLYSSLFRSLSLVVLFLYSLFSWAAQPLLPSWEGERGGAYLDWSSPFYMSWWVIKDPNTL